MNLNGMKRMLLALLTGVVLLAGVNATANAQGQGFRRPPRRVIYYRRYDPFWEPYRTVRVVDPIASQREEGYSEGRDKGKDDAKDGRDFDPENHKQFNKSKSLAFREAFLKGYQDGYRKQMNKGD
ncbi:MAG: hypothetical protein JNJ50_28800 [Acidobacteria bacterium]|nr:hypothetical protein [Acidobacteriota bacterium]